MEPVQLQGKQGSGSAGALPMPHVADVTHRMVQARGMNFHVASAGSGPPVVMLHGFPLHWYGWARQLPLLADDHHVVCPDLRGFGWSDAPATGYDTDTRVADVLALLDELGLQRVHLVGHEWGAWLGFHLCLRAPERFASLLAINVSHPWPRHRHAITQAWRYWYTAPLEVPGVGPWVLREHPRLVRYVLRRGAGRVPIWSDDEIEQFVASSKEPSRAGAGAALHRAIARHDIPALALGRFRTARLHVPTTVLAGSGDFALSPKVLGDGARNAPDMTVKVVAGGHFLPAERPQLVADLIRDGVRKGSSGRRHL